MSEELLPCPFVAVRRTLLSRIAVIIRVATVRSGILVVRLRVACMGWSWLFPDQGMVDKVWNRRALRVMDRAVADEARRRSLHSGQAILCG